MGGTRGRALQAGDILGSLTPEKPARLLRSVNDPLRSTAVSASSENAADYTTWRLRVLPGPGDPSKDEDHATATSLELEALVGQGRTFDVLPRSDRMAVIVSESEGIGSGDLVGGQQMSEACVSGTIQLPPDGNPVILLAEHQTTGGYKVPGVVIQADLWQVGQMRPGDKLVFEETTIDEAADALRRLHAQAAETEIRPMMESEIDLRRLARGVNQMGDVQQYGGLIGSYSGSDTFGTNDLPHSSRCLFLGLDRP